MFILEIARKAISKKPGARGLRSILESVLLKTMFGLFWKSQETNFLVKIYKKLLEYHILKKPLFLDIIDKSFNPIMGKSFAMNFEKL